MPLLGHSVYQALLAQQQAREQQRRQDEALKFDRDMQVARDLRDRFRMEDDSKQREFERQVRLAELQGKGAGVSGQAPPKQRDPVLQEYADVGAQMGGWDQAQFRQRQDLQRAIETGRMDRNVANVSARNFATDVRQGLGQAETGRKAERDEWQRQIAWANYQLRKDHANDALLASGNAPDQIFAKSIHNYAKSMEEGLKAQARIVAGMTNSAEKADANYKLAQFEAAMNALRQAGADFGMAMQMGADPEQLQAIRDRTTQMIKQIDIQDKPAFTMPEPGQSYVPAGPPPRPTYPFDEEE